ncbi:hypothetical protein ACFQDN_22225 [Pseudomonas asuensis]|uniref:Uncharacterized protein n=1 Tax=Pseudomonas asuensis TaxID=1825787 RepID=A0ABQ2H1C4_9PSED|nr:hypothetical protein [Pseudomonas asuensis]GGM25944.1 hypothetical protein GCM10009425_40860 [Pseudomonas asuensis]
MNILEDTASANCERQTITKVIQILSLRDENILDDISTDTGPSEQRVVIEVTRALLLRDGYSLLDLINAAERGDEHALLAVSHAASIVNFVKAALRS